MLTFKASTASQSITAATTAYSTGYLGYAAESAINQTPFDNRIAHMNGAISCLNGTFNFISGGFAGSFGTIWNNRNKGQIFSVRRMVVQNKRV